MERADLLPVLGPENVFPNKALALARLTRAPGGEAKAPAAS